MLILWCSVWTVPVCQGLTAGGLLEEPSSLNFSDLSLTESEHSFPTSSRAADNIINQSCPSVEKMNKLNLQSCLSQGETRSIFIQQSKSENPKIITMHYNLVLGANYPLFCDQNTGSHGVGTLLQLSRIYQNSLLHLFHFHFVSTVTGSEDGLSLSVP